MASLFLKDILLDEEAFQKASTDYADLAQKMEELQTEISNLLDELEKGFDTPAGRKFIKSCRSGLLELMRKQSIVINHVSTNLSQAKRKYQSVFNEYKALNNTINNI